MKFVNYSKRLRRLLWLRSRHCLCCPCHDSVCSGRYRHDFLYYTYDGNGNAMRYNSSASIGGYTAGGTGNYKYRMYVDGDTAFCIQPGVPLKTGNTLQKILPNAWNALSAEQKKAVGLALLYGYQGNSGNLSGKR